MLTTVQEVVTSRNGERSREFEQGEQKVVIEACQLSFVVGIEAALETVDGRRESSHKLHRLKKPAGRYARC